MTAMIVTLLPLLLTMGTRPSHPIADKSALAAQLGPEITISELFGDEYGPAIAYNSTHDEYLVVWHDAYDVIHAQRLSPPGQLLGASFEVASSARGKRQPSVAYDPVRDRYLVTWIYDYWGNGTDYDIYGRFIPWDGPSASFIDFSICPWTNNQWRPAVAFARTQDEFLVVWMNDGASPGVAKYISGRRVWADGSGFPVNPFSISSGPEDREHPDVAYNLARNEYLVTWDANIGGGNIYGMRLSGTGTPLGGGEFAIAGWSANERHPSVAACHKADQYLVAWESDQDTGGSDWAIYARYVSGGGVPGNVYLVDDSTGPDLAVEVNCDAGGRQYLLAWEVPYVTSWYGVWGRMAYPNETMDAMFPIIDPGPSHHRREPTVGGGGGHFLTAWEHEVGFVVYRDIHGRLVFPDLIFRDGFQ